MEIIYNDLKDLLKQCIMILILYFYFSLTLIKDISEDIINAY